MTKVSIPSFPMVIPKDTATMIAGSPEESNNEKLIKEDITAKSSSSVITFVRADDCRS